MTVKELIVKLLGLDTDIEKAEVVTGDKVLEIDATKASIPSSFYLQS